MQQEVLHGRRLSPDLRELRPALLPALHVWWHSPVSSWKPTAPTSSAPPGRALAQWVQLVGHRHALSRPATRSLPPRFPSSRSPLPLPLPLWPVRPRDVHGWREMYSAASPESLRRPLRAPFACRTVSPPPAVPTAPSCSAALATPTRYHSPPVRPQCLIDSFPDSLRPHRARRPRMHCRTLIHGHGPCPRGSAQHPERISRQHGSLGPR